jgi:hypothetical protein
MKDLTSFPNQDRILHERNFTLDAHISSPHLEFELLNNETQVCGDQASFLKYSLTKILPGCCSLCTSYVPRHHCPPFFSISTWKVRDQKYPKDNVILKTCSCFCSKREIKIILIQAISWYCFVYYGHKLDQGNFILQLSMVMSFSSHHQSWVYQWNFSCKVSAIV